MKEPRLQKGLGISQIFLKCVLALAPAFIFDAVCGLLAVFPALLPSVP